MNVLISGATGLIGTALSKALNDRGDKAIALVRPSSANVDGATAAWDPAAEMIDVKAIDALSVDAVVHLAGAGIADRRWNPQRKTEILESRTKATALLAGAIAGLDHAPRVFVSGSAIGIYGNRGDEILTEESSSGNGFLADVCLQWEAAADEAARAGIRTVIARTGIVLAREGGALAKQLPLFRAGIGGRLGSGSQWTSWITLADEVRALLALLDDKRFSGSVNLTAPSPVTNKDFTKALGHAVHRPTFFPVPPVALKIALGAELVDEALLASQRVSPTRLVEHGFSFHDPDIASAFASLLR
ncbi:MAG: TIGR01777 family oxidoreductase [Actinomycetes bacterium]